MFRLGFILDVSSAELCHSKLCIITRNYAVCHGFGSQWLSLHRSSPALGSQASCLSPSVSTGDMSIPVQGRVTLQNNQAVLTLAVTDSAPSPERPTSDLEMLLEKAMRQEVPVHESRLPLLHKHLAAMVCNVQKGLKLNPVGLYGAWDPIMAEAKLFQMLRLPRKTRRRPK